MAQKKYLICSQIEVWVKGCVNTASTWQQSSGSCNSAHFSASFDNFFSVSGRIFYVFFFPSKLSDVSRPSCFPKALSPITATINPRSGGCAVGRGQLQPNPGLLLCSFHPIQEGCKDSAGERRQGWKGRGQRGVMKKQQRVHQHHAGKWLSIFIPVLL